MTDPPNESAPAEAEATLNVTILNDTTETGAASPFVFQADRDLSDTITATNLVLEAFRIGYHDDLEAVRICGRAIRRKAHHTLVARINRRDGAA